MNAEHVGVTHYRCRKDYGDSSRLCERARGHQDACGPIELASSQPPSLPLLPPVAICPSCAAALASDNAVCDRCQPILEDPAVLNAQLDLINHPPHYKGRSLEAIDVIEAFELGFCEGNVVKYVLRWRKKNGLADLQKARWYLNRLIEDAEAKK